MDFCDACAKAKSTRLPYPHESKTRAEKYGDYVHWDLWGPTSVKSLNGHFYVATQIDDATRETKLYFQEKKSETFNSYKKDEAYIETQTGNRIIQTTAFSVGRNYETLYMTTKPNASLSIKWKNTFQNEIRQKTKPRSYP